MSTFVEYIVIHTTYGTWYSVHEYEEKAHEWMIKAFKVEGTRLHGMSNEPGDYVIPKHQVRCVEFKRVPRSYEQVA